MFQGTENPTVTGIDKRELEYASDIKHLGEKYNQELLETEKKYLNEIFQADLYYFKGQGFNYAQLTNEAGVKRAEKIAKIKADFEKAQIQIESARNRKSA